MNTTPMQSALRAAAFALFLAASGTASAADADVLKHQAVTALQNDHPEQVVKMLAPVAEQAEPDLQLLLALAYIKLQSVDEKPQKGVPWLRKAAKSGSAQAQQIYGSLLFKGIRVEKDTERGLYWLRRAALQDDPTALYNLGVAYLGGAGEQGAPSKPDLGLGLVLRAANLGSQQAKDLLDRFAEQAKDQLAQEK